MNVSLALGLPLNVFNNDAPRLAFKGKNVLNNFEQRFSTLHWDVPHKTIFFNLTI